MKKSNTSAQYSAAKSGSIADRLATRMRLQMFKRFIDLANIQPDDKVLDVGVTSDQELEASNYVEAWYPDKSQLTACGIDDASFLEVRYPGLRFVKADGTDLPFEAGEFGVVHSSAVLEHVGSREQQLQFISELYRVSRRVVFLTTPNRWFPVEFHSVLPLVHWLPPRVFRRVLRWLGHHKLAMEENLNLLSARDLRALCQSLGFKSYKVDTVRLGGWSSNLLLTIWKE